MFEKMFTTKMSADKKKMENRFSKIRSKNGRTEKLISGVLFGIIIISIITASVFTAVKIADRNGIINQLYEMKDTEFTDIGNIEKIVRLTNFVSYDFHSVEIVNNEYEKRVAVKFRVDDRAMHRLTDDTSLRKLSAIILALVPETEAVSCLIFDKYSQDISNWDTSFYSSYASKKHFHTRTDFEKFTKEYINHATSDTESFKEYFVTVSEINFKKELSDYLKQLYSFIGDDYEIVINSGIGSEFLVDDEFMNSTEYTAINNIFSVNLSEYKGLAVYLRKIDIRNFKTNETKKCIHLYYSEGDKTVFISHKIIDQGKNSDEVKLIIQRLMEKEDGIVTSTINNSIFYSDRNGNRAI